jgi:hypothetical protein
MDFSTWMFSNCIQPSPGNELCPCRMFLSGKNWAETGRLEEKSTGWTPSQPAKFFDIRILDLSPYGSGFCKPVDGSIQSNQQFRVEIALFS